MPPRNFAIPGLLALLATTLLFSQSADALIMVGKGNDAVPDRQWPAGSLDLANLKTRLGWWEGPPFGGGQFTFMYHGKEIDFQAALDLLAKIKVAAPALFIHDGGAMTSPFLKDDANPKSNLTYDWSFTVWNPDSYRQLHGSSSRISAEDPNGPFSKDVEMPRIDVYVGGNNSLDLKQIKIPANVVVTDERADSAGFKDGSAITGDVIDMVGHKPIADAKIELSVAKAYEEWTPAAASVQADNAGHFALTKAPDGNYGVLATAPGYAPRLLGYVSLRGNTFKHFNVRLAPATKLIGVALDQDGQPVAGITIRPDAITGPDDAGYILPKKPQAITDAQGHFELTDLPPGHTQIFAYGEHHLIANALAIEAIPSTDLTIKMVATGTITGRVTKPDGTPVTDGTVQLRADTKEQLGTYGGGAGIGKDGSFTYTNVPPGDYIISAQSTANTGTAIKVIAGHRIDVDLVQ
jgi:hypothetical protein